MNKLVRIRVKNRDMDFRCGRLAHTIIGVVIFLDWFIRQNTSFRALVSCISPASYQIFRCVKEDTSSYILYLLFNKSDFFFLQRGALSPCLPQVSSASVSCWILYSDSSLDALYLKLQSSPFMIADKLHSWCQRTYKNRHRLNSG